MARVSRLFMNSPAHAPGQVGKSLRAGLSVQFRVNSGSGMGNICPCDWSGETKPGKIPGTLARL